MNYTDEIIETALKNKFGIKKDKALKILKDYGTEPAHQEKNRVYLAAIKLSNGDLSQLENCIKTAKLDYRDILLLAEYERVSEKALDYKPLKDPYRDLLSC